MPLVAVAGIFVSGAAIAGGTLTALGTIAAIGTIVSSIGVLTENKTLMTIGAVAGLAGGVGAFAESQGWLASAGSGSAMADTTSNTAAMAETSGVGVESVTPTVDTGAVAVDTGAVDAGATQQVVDQGVTAGDAVAQGTTTTNITQGSELAAPQGGLIDAGVNNAEVLGNAPGALTKAQLDGTNIFGANSVPGAATATPTGSIFDTLKGGFDSIFRNADGSMNKDMLSMAGNFLGGMFDEKKEAETDWLKAQTDALNQQMANGNSVPKMNMGLSGQVRFKKKTPTYNRPMPGLMNAR